MTHIPTKLLTVAAMLVATLLTAPAQAQAQAQQKLLPAQSDISFAIKQMGVGVEGHFKRFDAQIAFDPAKLDAAKMAFTVDLASATMGTPDIDSELPRATWFNTAKFPQATFQSSTVKALGGGKYEVSGKLAVKGNVRDVVVPVLLVANGATTTASGTFPIKRLAFKIGENEWADTSMVADDVQVKFKLALTGVGKF